LPAGRRSSCKKAQVGKQNGVIRGALYENESAFMEVEIGEQQLKKQKVEIGLSDGINIETLSGKTVNQKIKSH